MKEEIHKEVYAEKNKHIDDRINVWIGEFIDNGEDMDAYWQDSLKHLIWEIKLTTTFNK
jgi:hypothetical protein